MGLTLIYYTKWSLRILISSLNETNIVPLSVLVVAKIEPNRSAKIDLGSELLKLGTSKFSGLLCNAKYSSSVCVVEVVDGVSGFITGRKKNIHKH